LAKLLQSDLLPGIPHGFSTRDGIDGVAGPIVRVKQIHSAKVVTVGSQTPWNDVNPPQADAMVTNCTGVWLGIVTADCAPVLLADANAGVVGAAHAGWRGAVDGVLANTIEAMEALGARRERISAAIGPCIAQASYEVDAPFRERFDEAHGHHFEPGKPDHWQFDLPGFVEASLTQAGVTSIDSLARDTYCEEDCFYSYRRATHRGQDTGGRQTSLIGMEI